MCTAEIAVLLGGDGRTVPLGEPGTLVVFRRERRLWQKNREQEIALDPAAGLPGCGRLPRPCSGSWAAAGLL